MFSIAPFLVLVMLPAALVAALLLLPSVWVAVKAILSIASRLPAVQWRNLFTLGGLCYCKTRLSLDDFVEKNREWHVLVKRNKENLEALESKDNQIKDLKAQIVDKDCKIERLINQLEKMSTNQKGPINYQKLDPIYSPGSVDTTVFELNDYDDVGLPKDQDIADTGVKHLYSHATTNGSGHASYKSYTGPAIMSAETSL